MTHPASTHRASLTASGALLALLVLLVWLVADVDKPSSAHGLPELVGERGTPRGPTSPTFAATPDPFAPAHIERVIADYQRLSVYPPGSRPHDPGTAYKLAWNEPAIPPLPELGDRGLLLRFGSDRTHVLPGEVLTTWIEAFDPSAPERRLPIVVREAWVTAIGGESLGRLAPLVYAAEGGQRFVNRLDPATVPRLADRCEAVRLVALVEVDGRTNQITRDFTYTPREVLRVHGVRDAIVDGSLSVILDVEVIEAGVFSLEANLFGGDQPLVWVDQGAELAPGRHDIELRFFGKAVRDQGVPGPWVVRDVHGVMRSQRLGEMPLRFSWAGEHVTAAYALDELSPAAWSSPEKLETLAALEALSGGGDEPLAGEEGAPPRHYIVIGTDGIAREYLDGEELPEATFGH